MDTLRLGFIFLHCLVLFRMSTGSSPGHKAEVTAGQLVHTRAQVHSTGHHHPDMDEYLSENYEDDLSADYDIEYPRVEYSTKHKDSSATHIKENTRKAQRLSRNRKKDPCLRKKYRNFCIHGECQFLKELNHTFCRCEEGYIGERCHSFSLPVGKNKETGNNHTTTLAVTVTVLSVTCLTIFGILLAIRYHKKRNCDVDEKIRLEAATVQ